MSDLGDAETTDVRDLVVSDRTPALPPPPVVVDPAGFDLDEQLARDAIGSLHERYELIELLGQGGMGLVYKVRHRRLGREFALKMIRPELRRDPRMNRIFVREARLASSLSHPHIVAVVDYGEGGTAEGPYMVMELLAGRPLSHRLRGEGRLSPRSACELLLQVAKAMAFVHRHGIIHLDLKADNVFLCTPPDDDRRRVLGKLLDFGLARHDQSTTMSSTIDGTPAYIAPERLEGARPSPSMDIYSLGVLAFEIFTGRQPFVGEITDVLEAHARRSPPTFAEVGLTGVDERAEAVVRHMLAKAPGARPPSMEALVYELRTLRNMLGERRPGRPARRDDAGDFSWVGPAFRASPLPIACVDIEGCIEHGNAAFWRFLDSSGEERPGINIMDTGLRASGPAIMHDIRRAWVSGHPRCVALHVGDSTVHVWIYGAAGIGERLILMVHRA